MRQNRRRKNRQNTGRARRCWKGMLAVIAAAATFLTGIDVTGLQTVFANGTSGYKIEVSYSEDQSQATLTGNTDRLAQGVTMVSVTDAEGREYSPSEFSYPVTENGDYTFTVDYKVEEATLIREEKEELTVTVDGIQKAGTEENAPKDDNVAQERMAVSALLVQAQNAEEQITPYELPVYTSESNLALGQTKIPYSGGVFSEELTGELTDYPGRVFDYAYFVFSGDDTEFPLLGLYPLYNEAEKKTEWYYILQDESGSGSGGTSGSVMEDIEAKVAIKLPDNAEVRAKYKVTTTPFPITKTYITPEGSTDNDQGSIARWNTSLVDEGRGSEQIVVTFTLPAEYTSAIVEVIGADGSLIQKFDTANAASTGLQENVGGIDGRYSGVFSMVSQAVTVKFNAKITGEENYKNFGFAWPRAEDKSSSGNVDVEAGRVFASINTDSVGNAEYKSSYISDTRESNIDLFYWYDTKYRPGKQQSIPLYNSEDTIKSRRIAQGQYKRGETQTIQIEYEMGSYSDSASNRYTYVPTVLDFYVYKGGSFGADPSQENVLMEQIALPQSKGATITQQLESGGTVAVTLTEKNYRTPSQQVADSNFGNNKWDEPNDKYFTGGREYSHPYWKYEIKVSGTRYPYVVSLLDDSGAQEGFVVKEMTGVEAGEGLADGSANQEYSVYFENRGGTGRKAYPLRQGSVMWEKFMADTHPTTSRPATMLHLVPKMGYGWPTITLENAAPGQQPGRDITPRKTQNGKTYYTHYISSASNGGNYRETVTSINIVSEPIRLNVKYGSGTGGGSNPSNGVASLKPSSDRYYSVILQSGLVSSGQYMNGYILKIKNKNNQEITISNPDNTNGKWYPGDILDVQDLYWKMASGNSSGTPFLLQGQGMDVNTYTMTFSADISTTPQEGSYGSIDYTIRTQTDFNNWTGNPTNADHEVMYKTGFSNRTDTVMGYIGSQTLLRNYPEYVEDGTKNYIVSDYSVTESVITGTDDKLDLVYLMGAQVEFTGLRSNFSNNLVEKPGNSGTYVYAEETWFTGMDKHDNVIDLSSIDPGDPAANKVFAGWKITNTGGDAYNNGNPINGNLDLYAMGNTNRTLWNQIFKTDGVIKLEAQWADAMQRITLPDGTMTAPQEEVKMYQSPYTISATFNMASAVSAGSTADYAIYIYKDKQWGIADLGRIDLNTESITRATQNRLWGNIADADCTADVTTTGNSTDITLTVSNIKNLAGNRNEYRIYMWNSKNGDANLWQDSSTIQAGYMKNLDAFQPVENYPYKSLLVRQIPKVFTEDSTQITESKKDKLFYEGQEFTVSGTFSLETGQSNADKKDTFDQIHTNNTNTEIKVALYKVDPPGTTGNYDIWSINSGPVTKHSGKVSAPTITRISDTKFTVSFTITDSSGSISNKWDDGAKYRVFAWTNSNGGVTSNPDFGQERDAFPVNDNITTIPSTTTTMAGVLGQQVESIIQYPKQITMLDNVVPNNKHIFSGNEKITIQPTLNDGRSAEIPDSDIGVDVVIRELNGNQTFNITRGTETIPLKGFIGTVGKGSAIPSNGKMGTLKFDPDNNSTQDLLQFYFRSENPPTVADGAAFEGTIHFEFSNGSGTTN